MDELFRFVALRPPMPSSDAIVLDGNTPLAASLAEARRGTSGREAMNRLAQSFVRSDDFVQDPATLNLPFDHLADALDQPDASERSVSDLVERTLGASAADLVDSREFAADVARLQDSVLAIKLAPPENGDPATVLRMLGAADVVQQIASDRRDVKATTKRLVLMPSSIFPLPAPIVKAQAPVTPTDPAAEEAQHELEKRAAAIVEALRALIAAGQLLAATNPEAATTGRGSDPLPPSERTARRTASSEPRSGLSTLLLDKVAISRLRADVRETLADLGIDPVTTTLPTMLKILSIELGKTERMIR